jgi:uncharacterized lipoprotein YajG
MMNVSTRNMTRTLIGIGIVAFFIGACGREPETQESGEHALSAQQQALERSRQAARALEAAAAQRAAQPTPSTPAR